MATPTPQVRDKIDAVGQAGPREWRQPLDSMLHTKLNRLVGPVPLHLEFDTSDADFVTALTSRWPRNTQSDEHLVFDHVGLIKLADVMNELVRLYALETGHTFVHVLVEARHGVTGVPTWWSDAACLFVTYGFDTKQGEVCLAQNPAQAFERMEWIAKPHRLMLAVGPGTPEHLRRSDDVWEQVDGKQLQSLQRWEQQLSQQLARLLSFSFGGGMMAEEALVDALASMRGSASRVRSAITNITRRRTNQLKEDDKQQLVEAMRDIKSNLERQTENKAMAAPVRAALRRGLVSLNRMEKDMKGPASHFTFRPNAVKQQRVARIARQNLKLQRPRLGIAGKMRLAAKALSGSLTQLALPLFTWRPAITPAASKTLTAPTVIKTLAVKQPVAKGKRIRRGVLSKLALAKKAPSFDAFYEEDLGPEAPRLRAANAGPTLKA